MPALSAPIRVVLLTALLGVAALLAGVVWLQRVQDRVVAKPATPQRVATPRPAHAKPVRHAARPTPKPKAKAAPVRHVTRKPAAPAPTNGLPGSIAVALRSAPVVVVSLYSSRDSIDQMALAEAQDGARSAGAAFVAVNVDDGAQLAELGARLQSISVPAVVVFRQPAEIAMQIDGFADRDVVAQAAASAR